METFIDKSELLDRMKQAKIQVDALLARLNRARRAIMESIFRTYVFQLILIRSKYR